MATVLPLAPVAPHARSRAARLGPAAVTRPREVLPSVSMQELVDTGGFQTGDGRSSHAMRWLGKLPYLSDDHAANDFLAEHGFDRAGEPIEAEQL